jgi:hypothetical protein
MPMIGKGDRSIDDPSFRCRQKAPLLNKRMRVWGSQECKTRAHEQVNSLGCVSPPNSVSRRTGFRLIERGGT